MDKLDPKEPVLILMNQVNLEHHLLFFLRIEQSHK